MGEVDVHICRARGLEDYRACVELQKEVWGFSNTEDIVPQPLFLIGNDYGGSVLLAEEPGSGVIGFAFAMLGRKPDGALIWWSHMTGVSRNYQGCGVGFHLKLAQREDALEHGISEIWWTFDPLQAVNADFNLRKLGAIVCEYEENIYGVSSSPLHHGMPTDRLVAEWHLESERVKNLSSGEAPVIQPDFGRLLRVIEIHDQQPGPPNLELEESPILLEIPSDFLSLQKTDPQLARAWQREVRAACHHYFDRGYAMTNFMMVDTPNRQALYLMEKSKR